MSKLSVDYLIQFPYFTTKFVISSKLSDQYQTSEIFFCSKYSNKIHLLDTLVLNVGFYHV